ncbi:MAG: YdcF family protein [Candidatus Kerfeldbacteria bacterium]
MIINDSSTKYATIGLWTMFGLSVVLAIFVFTGINNLFVMPLERSEDPQSADVIIVLGGGVVKETRSLPWSVQERMRQGIVLYRQGYATNMILAGGTVSGESYTESEIMKAYAQLLGIAPGDLFEEKSSTSTYENATNSLEIMNDKNWKSALVVTSDYHTKRACKVFEKLDIEIICISASLDSIFEKDGFRRLIDARSIFREYIATVYYYLRGYL